MKKIFESKIGIFIFAIGALVGFTMAFLMTWANFELPFYFERSYFSVSTPSTEKMELSCPLLLTIVDEGSIKAYLPNTTDKTINLDFRTQISYMDGIEREVQFNPEVLSGETGVVDVKIDSADRFYNMFILMRAFQFPTYKTPARAGSCAVVMLPFTFVNGSEAIALILAVIILFMLGGLLLFARINRPLAKRNKRIFNSMLVMAIFICIAIAAGVLSFWVLGIAMLAVIFLQTVTVFVFFGDQDRKN